MSLFKRIFSRTLKLKPSVQTEAARMEPGPLTVHEAWRMAKPQALSMDSDAALLLITSGTDLQADGRSFTWAFLFHLVNRGVRLLLMYGPAAGADDIESAPIVVEKRITAAPAGGAAVLPMAFRDSPEVVAELGQAGVDFVAGPTDMKLETRFSDEGRPVWVTYFWEKQLSVAFAGPSE